MGIFTGVGWVRQGRYGGSPAAGMARLGGRWVAVGVPVAGVLIALGGGAQADAAQGALPGRTEDVVRQDEPDLVVRSVTLNRSTAAVSGLATLPLTVTVRAARNPDAGGSPDELYVDLRRTGGSRPEGGPTSRLVHLKRTAGTAADGTYVGTTPISSTMNGTFAVTRAWPWVDLIGTGVSPDPVAVAGPSLQVTGTHIPKLTLTNSPMPVPISAKTYRFGGRLVDSDTGTGYVKPVRLTIGLDNVCVESFPGESAVTDRAGYFSILRRRGDHRWLHCATVSATKDWYGDIITSGYWVQVRPWVSAKPAQASVRVSRPLQVTGKVGGAPSGCIAALQRLDGSRWRQETSATIRQSGRVTLTARPPRAGRIAYRVATPRCSSCWPATSTPFVVRVTR